MKIAITGHRPNKLGNDYNLTSPLIESIKKDIIYHAIFCNMSRIKDVQFITGMALGIDTLFAKLAIEFDIPL